jgi:hypothetical protein
VPETRPTSTFKFNDVKTVLFDFETNEIGWTYQ